MDLVEVTSYSGCRHPWELSRRDVAVKLINDLGLTHQTKVIDVGAGDCFVARSVKAAGLTNITVVDSCFSVKTAPSDLNFCRDISEVSEQTADLVIALDVLEHVEDDVAFAKSLVEKLKPNGQLLVTVPAWQFLFGGHDIFLKHFRRYRTKPLKHLFEAQGLTVTRCHYFFFSLFLIRSLQKASAFVLNTADNEDIGVAGWPHSEEYWMTKLAEFILECDFKFCAALALLGIAIPGLSVVLVGKVKKHQTYS